MLPAYRLRCLLLSCMRDDATTTATATTMRNGRYIAEDDGPGRGRSSAAGEGWGIVGHSILAGGIIDGDPLSLLLLPSQSFALKSFPCVPTPGGGGLSVSVMYDATLDPHCMMDDLAERRGAWLQRRLASHQLRQQQHYNLQ